MTRAKVLIIQNDAKIGCKGQNLRDIEKLLEKHKGSKFDLVILPELFAVGWYPQAFAHSAETLDDSPTLDFLKSIAKEYSSNVIGGSFVLKEDDGTLRNACPFINRDGELVDFYYKMHLFSHFIYDEGKHLTEGQKGLVINSDIGKIGVAICYDIRFPELFRAYAYEGAELMVEVAAWPKYRQNHWESLSRARAIENQSFMISVSQCGHIMGAEWNLGHSMVIAPFGDTICELGNEPCTKVVEIDLDEAKRLRKDFNILKDRHSLPYEVREI